MPRARTATGTFDKTSYMRQYMRDLREAKARSLPPVAERKKRWESRAEEMRAIAETMTGVPRMMMEKLAEDYEWLAGRIDHEGGKA